MHSPRSQLVFTTFEPAEPPSTGVVIPLHGHAGHPEDLVPLAHALAPHAELRVPRAPRPAYFGRDTVAHYWYVGEREGTPDPPSFGDCLFQVEQFTLDVVESAGEEPATPILIGVGQGAVLALAAAKVIPDLLGGVVALAGYLPRIPGIELPAEDLAGLPILMINGADDQPHGLVHDSAASLRADGATLELHDGVDTGLLASPELHELVGDWGERTGTHGREHTYDKQ
jgi:phospholipase/carboxylesterase